MQEFFSGAASVVGYIIPAAVIMLAARALIRFPDELFRKILHFIFLSIYLPVLFLFDRWWVSGLLIVALMILLYPLLTLAGRIPAFSKFVNERKTGEFRRSMMLALGTMLITITVCWGIVGDRYLVLASVYAWGVGDGFGALIGKPFGKHKITLKCADHRKSVGGSAAMFVTSAIAVFVVMMVRGGMGIPGCLLVAAAASAVSTFVEMCTKNGDDTITCPVAAMAVVLPLTQLLGG